MAKKIVVGIMVVLMLVFTVFSGIVISQPNEYSITRSATIAAPQPVVFAQVNDFHNWQEWSPWAKLDPKATAIFEGKDAGPGAIFKWSGNKEVGEGQMTITETKPNDLIRIKLDFLRPMKDTANTEFKFTPEGDKTKVTWTMSGTRGFMGKAFCLIMNMDKMVGGDFEKGLANMKTKVEDNKK